MAFTALNKDDWNRNQSKEENIAAGNRVWSKADTDIIDANFVDAQNQLDNKADASTVPDLSDYLLIANFGTQLAADSDYTATKASVQTLVDSSFVPGATLAGTGGAALVGATGDTTVQAEIDAIKNGLQDKAESSALDAYVQSTTLAANGGAALVGITYDGADSTVAAAITALEARIAALESA